MPPPDDSEGALKTDDGSEREKIVLHLKLDLNRQRLAARAACLLPGAFQYCGPHCEPSRNLCPPRRADPGRNPTWNRCTKERSRPER